MPEGIFCLKHMKKFLLAVLLVLIVLPAAYCFAASNNVVSTLDKAGLENVIRSNKGKPVIVNFFATWCPVPGRNSSSGQNAGEVRKQSRFYRPLRGR